MKEMLVVYTSLILPSELALKVKHPSQKQAPFRAKFRSQDRGKTRQSSTR